MIPLNDLLKGPRAFNTCTYLPQVAQDTAAEPIDQMADPNLNELPADTPPRTALLQMLSLVKLRWIFTSQQFFKDAALMTP